MCIEIEFPDLVWAWTLLEGNEIIFEPCENTYKHTAKLKLNFFVESNKGWFPMPLFVVIIIIII